MVAGVGAVMDEYEKEMRQRRIEEHTRLVLEGNDMTTTNKTKCVHGYKGTTYEVLRYGQAKNGAQTTIERCTVCGKRREMTQAQHVNAQRINARNKAKARAKAKAAPKATEDDASAKKADASIRRRK